MIDKDTLIFGSFAKQAGNNGCKMFNPAFEYYGLNAIYKSFSVTDIGKAIEASKILNFKGFAITMPFKKDALKYVDHMTTDVAVIGATNTIINDDGRLTAYNTDYLAAKEFLEKYKGKPLFILGNGGYSSAVKYAAKILGFEPEIITRQDWNTIHLFEDSIIYNCTPVTNIKVHESNIFIDCIVTTPTGYELSKIQASHQFKLYTGLDFPIL